MREKKRITIVTGFSLRFNPRVLKEAMTLSQAGYEVIVLGAESDRVNLEISKSLAARYNFQFESVGFWAEQSGLNQIQSSWYRFRSRLGRELFQVTKIENRYQLGYFAQELLSRAQVIEADYYIMHLEQGLWVGAKLLQSGKLVGIDMEDWYTEDLLPEARTQRPLNLLRTLERNILCGAAHSSCPSEVMSEALAREFECRQPAVIYNAFEWADRHALDNLLKDRKGRRIPTIHWYSQTLGHGRGLEDLLAALPQVKHEVEIHLRGNPVNGFDDWLAARVSDDWGKRIFVHGLVSNEELLSRIAEHDIGFAGEMKFCQSRDLTVTNKILHYLLGGLAVVASDTAGQCEIAAQAPGAVFIYPSGNTGALADSLNMLLSSPERLSEAKATALRAAEQKFCWEHQAPKLLSAIEAALKPRAFYSNGKLNPQ